MATINVYFKDDDRQKEHYSVQYRRNVHVECEGQLVKICNKSGGTQRLLAGYPVDDIEKIEPEV
jgi:hypothetical protein